MKKVELKRKLVKMGIPVKAGMVKKSDIKKVLASEEDNIKKLRKIQLRLDDEFGIDIAVYTRNELKVLAQDINKALSLTEEEFDDILDEAENA